MPDRFQSMLDEASLSVIFFLIGALAEVARHFKQQERHGYKVLFGRAISNGLLAVSAGAVIAFVPSISSSPLALCGLSAFIAVLGQEFILRLTDAFVAQWLAKKSAICQAKD